jgi:hypothetical protein
LFGDGWFYRKCVGEEGFLKVKEFEYCKGDTLHVVILVASDAGIDVVVT